MSFIDREARANIGPPIMPANTKKNDQISPSTDVQVSLTSDEAIVLFEFVRRFSNSHELTIVDQVEQRVLWNLCCIFERGVMAHLEGDWADLLRHARERLRDE